MQAIVADTRRSLLGCWYWRLLYPAWCLVVDVAPWRLSWVASLPKGGLRRERSSSLGTGAASPRSLLSIIANFNDHLVMPASQAADPNACRFRCWCVLTMQSSATELPETMLAHDLLLLQLDACASSFRTFKARLFERWSSSSSFNLAFFTHDKNIFLDGAKTCILSCFLGNGHHSSMPCFLFLDTCHRCYAMTQGM